MSFRARTPRQPPDPQTVVGVALALLSRRALSAGELRRRLAARGFDAQACALGEQAMRRYGYVNDAALAQACVGEAQRQGRGAAWVRQKLSQRHVDADTAAAAASATDADVAAAQRRAVAVLQRRLRHRPRPPDAAAARADGLRALRFLLRRGFSFACARYAVAQAGPAVDLSDLDQEQDAC